MEDRNQGLNTTSRRSRRIVFKGPIRGFIHRASGRGEVVAYSDHTGLGDARGSSPGRVGNASDTPFHDVDGERVGGKLLQSRGSNENRVSSGDNSLREHRRIQQPPTSQDGDLAESRAIVEDLLRRSGTAGSARSPNQVRTNSARKPENRGNRVSDERIPDSENKPVFNFRQLEKEFHKLSPKMQRYLTWLQTATQSEYLFTLHYHAARPHTDVNEDKSQR